MKVIRIFSPSFFEFFVDFRTEDLSFSITFFNLFFSDSFFLSPSPTFSRIAFGRYDSPEIFSLPNDDDDEVEVEGRIDQSTSTLSTPPKDFEGRSRTENSQQLYGQVGFVVAACAFLAMVSWKTLHTLHT